MHWPAKVRHDPAFGSSTVALFAIDGDLLEEVKEGSHLNLSELLRYEKAWQDAQEGRS